MSQILVKEKKKFLTFEELCKEWSLAISHAGGITKVQVQPKEGLDLKFYYSCIVGEAYGFDNGYMITRHHGYCGECEKFGNMFYRMVIRNSQIITHYALERMFEIEKTRFVSHFNAVHVK